MGQFSVTIPTAAGSVLSDIQHRAAYIFAQKRFLYGPVTERRREAAKFIMVLKREPLGSTGTKEQIADRYVNLKGVRPLWYLATHSEAYYLPDHDMM
jgi:hypothetical protein